MMSAGKGSFSEISCQWQGPPLTVLGTKCGETVFILLHNESGTPVKGDIVLPFQAATDRAISIYDPQRNVTNNLASLGAGKNTITGVSVPATNYLVMIIAP